MTDSVRREKHRRYRMKGRNDWEVPEDADNWLKNPGITSNESTNKDCIT